MSDMELHREVADLRDKVSNLEAEVRVTKHGVNNMMQTQNGLASRLDKLEERLGGKIDKLVEGLATVNTTQARGAGFFAGIAFVVTGCGAMLLAIGKLLFTGHVG